MSSYVYGLFCQSFSNGYFDFLPSFTKPKSLFRSCAGIVATVLVSIILLCLSIYRMLSQILNYCSLSHVALISSIVIKLMFWRLKPLLNCLSRRIFPTYPLALRISLKTIWEQRAMWSCTLYIPVFSLRTCHVCFSFFGRTLDTCQYQASLHTHHQPR